MAAFGGRLTRTLLRILVTRRGQFVSKEVLAEALWGDRQPADPARNLEILVVRARRALEDPTLIVTAPGGYLFSEDEGVEVDAEIFLRTVEQGRRALEASRPAYALVFFKTGLERWRGEPLAEDALADWSQEYRRELTGAHLDALEGAATAALASNDPRLAVIYAEAEVAREPLREAGHLLLMRALAASNDPAAALTAFELLRTRLAEDLGLDPSPETQALQLQILRGETLGTLGMMPVPAATASSSPVAVSDRFRFVGREPEVERIVNVAGVVLIVGATGAGKTRLLTEAAQRADGLAIYARAFLAGQDEPWALARSLLREALALDVEAVTHLSDHESAALVDTIPELQDLRTIQEISLDPESRRALALEGSIRLLAATLGDGLVLVDDVHWIDPTSARLLRMILTHGGGISLALAYREEELSAGGAAASLVEELRRDVRPVEIELGPLAHEAIASLSSGSQLSRVLEEGTDRTPLGIVEALGLLADRAIIEQAADGRWRLRSGKVAAAREASEAGQRRTIELRASRLTAEARKTLEILSLLGRETPARLVARARQLPEERVFEALESLTAAGLARIGEEGWAVSHDLVTETIASSMTAAGRVRVHSSLAAALEEDRSDDSEVARHRKLAGDLQAAAISFAKAASRALAAYANDEARLLADEGLALDPEPYTRGELLQTRAETGVRMGRSTEAAADLRAALALTARPERSLVLTRLAMLEAGREDYSGAGELADLALKEAGNVPNSRAAALTARARIDLNLGDLSAARARSEEALALFQREGDPQGRAWVLDTQAVTALEEGALPEAADLFDRVSRLFCSFGDLVRSIMPRATRGYVLTLMAKPLDGLADIQEAAEIAHQVRHREGECYCLFQRALTEVALGRATDALAHAEAALAFAREIGHREWTAASCYAIGFARLASGAVPEAEMMFRESLKLSEDMPIHSVYASVGLARALIGTGDLDGANAAVAEAVKAAALTPKGVYLADLAGAELANARGDRHAGAIAREAMARAEAGGHLASLPRLQELAVSAAVPMDEPRTPG